MMLTPKPQTEPQEASNIEKLSVYVKYFLEHLEELLLQQSNTILQAKYFGVIFNKAPTYQGIAGGTSDISRITDINEMFVPKNFNLKLMAGTEGFEPPNARTKTWCLTTWPRPIRSSGQILN